MNVSSCVNCPVDVNPFEDSNATSKGRREGKQASKQVPVCIVVAYRVPKYFVFLFSLLASLLTFGIKLSFVFKQKKKQQHVLTVATLFLFFSRLLKTKQLLSLLPHHTFWSCRLLFEWRTTTKTKKYKRKRRRYCRVVSRRRGGGGEPNPPTPFSIFAVV